MRATTTETWEEVEVRSEKENIIFFCSWCLQCIVVCITLGHTAQLRAWLLNDGVDEAEAPDHGDVFQVGDLGGGGG